MWKLAALALASIAVVTPSNAQESWPQRQVTFVVPFGPGGAADYFARLVADGLQAKYGKPFVVENRSGAAGNIGIAAVTKATPDGYTLLLGTVAGLSINPYVYKKLPYDIEKDLQPVALIAKQPNMLVVSKNLPVNDLNDFIAYMKKKSGNLTFASSGIGTSQQMACELLVMMTGTKATHVPYRSSADIMNSMLGGHVDFAFDNVAIALPHVREGTLRALAVSGKERSAMVPDVPTVDATLKGFDATSWHGVAVHSGVPKDIVEQLSADIRTLLDDPVTIKRINDFGATPAPMTPAEFAAFLKTERAKWRELVLSIGLSVD